MYLEKLEILGFKSFAHKVTLKFLPGITCVVGPNGSGKSNVSDAVRWVLGEQSMKMLRGKKSEDVIFAGSTKLSRLGFAQVSLHLNNEDKKAPIDYSEVVITRRLYRNGESEYLLNKVKVRLQDILLFLAKSNFGQQSYSIISQGMIDSILKATPLERKEFFDEAAGIRQYQIKKEQTLSKLAATRENLNRAEIMVAEIDPRLKSLTRQIKKLERREELEKSLKELQIKYYAHLWHYINKDYGEKKNKFEESEKKYQEIEKELGDIQKKMEENTKLKVENKKIIDLEAEYQKVLELKNNLLRQQVILEGKLEIEKEKIKENNVSLNIPPEEVRDFLEKLENIERLNKDLISKISQIKSLEEIQEIKKDIGLISEEITKIVLKIKKPQIDKTLGQEEKINSFGRELQNILKELEEKEKRTENLIKEISNFKKEEQSEREGIFVFQRQFHEKQNEFTRVNLATNDIKIELTKIETRREDLGKEILEELGDSKCLDNQAVEESFDAQTLLPEIHQLKHSLEIIGGIDPEINKEYGETKERFDFLYTQIEDLKKATGDLEKILKELEEMIKKQFEVSFERINLEFEKYFKILFNGGKARLILQKEVEIQRPTVGVEGIEAPQIDEPQKNKGQNYSGVDIQATPPGKRLKNISLLSGGERALTSLALICAIISCNPSPFVILDEVDAALDELNSVKFAEIIKNLSDQSQFIVITHNRATMERAKILYGVTIGDDGVSKLLSIKLEDIVNSIE